MSAADFFSHDNVAGPQLREKMQRINPVATQVPTRSGASAPGIEMRQAQRSVSQRHFSPSERAETAAQSWKPPESKGEVSEGKMRRVSTVRRWFNVLSKSFRLSSEHKRQPLPQAHAVLTSNTGLPLREGLQKLYKIKRDKLLIEMVVFVLFFGMYLTIVLEAYPVPTAFVQDDAMYQRFVDEDIPASQYKKTYMDISDIDDYWNWLSGVFVPGVNPVEWYNGDPYSEADLGAVSRYNRIVGPVELRQMRVSNQSCHARRFLEYGHRYDTKDFTCYAEFRLKDIWDDSTEDRAPFGPPNDTEKYKWSSGHGPLYGLYGFGPDNYGNGGYVVYFNSTQAEDTVNELFKDRWVDKGTRAVAHTFSVYNTNTRLLTIVRLTVEFMHSGDIQISYVLLPVRMVMYDGKIGKFRTVLEILFGLMWLYQLQKEVKRFYWSRPRAKYLMQPRNIFEVMFLTVNFGFITCWIRLISSKTRNSFDDAVTTYVNYFELGELYQLTFTFAGFSAIFSTFKLFKFMSINKRMSALWITLEKALYDLFVFMVGFVIIIVGFGILGHLLFGHSVRNFHTVPSSVSSLARFILGDFNYTDLSLSRPELAAVFFWMFNSIVFLVLMNTFIAIITLYFEEVHKEAKTSDRWKEGMPDLTFDAVKAVRRFGRNHLKRKFDSARYWCQTCCRKEHRLMSKLAMKKLTDSGVELQLEIWEREAAFEDLLREAARSAKRRTQSIDLFRYFERAFRDNKSSRNYYIGLSELCMITAPEESSDCNHTSCLARAILLAYTNFKDVLLINGEERTHGSDFVGVPAVRYMVVKVNKWGKKQERILAIDSSKQELHSFDTEMHLKRVLQLSLLVQIDKSRVDSRRLSLVFTEAIATQYHLLFRTPQDREDFCANVFNAALGEADPTQAPSAPQSPRQTARTSGVDWFDMIMSPRAGSTANPLVVVPPDAPETPANTASDTAPASVPIAAPPSAVPSGQPHPIVVGGRSVFTFKSSPPPEAARPTWTPRTAVQSTFRRSSWLNRQTSFFNTGGEPSAFRRPSSEQMVSPKDQEEANASIALRATLANMQSQLEGLTREVRRQSQIVLPQSMQPDPDDW